MKDLDKIDLIFYMIWSHIVYLYFMMILLLKILKVV